jgi:CheY-like chemotaxis protein
MAGSPLDLKFALVVADHPGIREIVCEILESRKCIVQRAQDCLDALALATTGRTFDLLVEAISIPHADGFNLAEELLRQRPTLKVLVITGRIEGTEFASMATLPNVRFIGKPFDPTELIHAAEQLFTSGQRTRRADA